MNDDFVSGPHRADCCSDLLDNARVLVTEYEGQRRMKAGLPVSLDQVKVGSTQPSAGDLDQDVVVCDEFGLGNAVD